MILSFLLYKIQRYPPHKWNIHSHRRQTVQIYQEDDPVQSPKSILPHPKGPQHQTHITTSWQNVPMPLRAHKWSSMVDTHHNQLTKGPSVSLCLQMVLPSRHTSQSVGKMPKWYCVLTKSSTSNTSQNTSCPKEKLAGRTPADLLSLGASKRIFPFFQGKTSAGSQCWVGEKQEDPRNKWLQPLLRMFPQISLPRPASQEQRSQQQASSQPSHSIVRPQSCLWMPETAISREHREATWEPKNCNRKWGPVAPSSELSEEARLVEMNVCFIAETGSESG